MSNTHLKGFSEETLYYVPEKQNHYSLALCDYCCCSSAVKFVG